MCRMAQHRLNLGYTQVGLLIVSQSILPYTRKDTILISRRNHYAKK